MRSLTVTTLLTTIGISLLTLLTGARVARAQMRAGSAAIERDSSSPPPSPSAGGLSACNQQCVNQGVACGSNVGGGRSPSQIANQCAAQMKACTAICNATSSGNGNDNGNGNSDDDEDSAPAMPDPQALYDRLLRTFQENDRQRLNDANRRALQLTNDILQVLCRQMNVKTCSTGTGQWALPPSPPRRPVSERWSKTLPRTSESPANQAGGESQKPRSKRFEGCYREVTGHPKGMWGDDRLTLDASIVASFTAPQSDVLVVRNNTPKTAWVGTAGPLNREIPAWGEITIELVVYRSKTDYRSSEADLYVKAWTDSEAKCAQGSSPPGFTTPEEWGPSKIDEGAHAIQ